ncbi:putative symporter YjmB [Marinomonas spartinae]|uniref:MFS transporter n=1 Tax=Marinomonas spartinae TaxID=1792290 RepID=UPI000808E2B6|nr:glycoside-pentoside-hexuronide (GPH):cation symporter [Marinomonas spartinae]SBS39760.1 putative symporter YjmB [Marinomonas spartinae]
MSQDRYETGRKERLSYYTFFTGQNIIFMFVTIFISIYYTSVLGLSAGVVGIIFLIARVWDTINDPMLSVLVERSRFKGGKFKPWINAIAWAVPLATVLIFAFGDEIAQLPMWMRITYAFVTYVGWGMLYTISDAPSYALGSVMTKNKEERNVIYSFVRFGGFVGMVIAMVGAPLLVDKLGGKWTMAAVIMCLLAMVLMLTIRTVKERHVVEQQIPTLKQIVSAVANNRYLLLFILAFVFISGSNFAFTLMPYVARDVFNDTTLSSLFLFAMIGPAMLASPLVPFGIRKIGKIATFAWAAVAMAVLSIITWFVGYEHIEFFVALTMIKAIALGVILIMPSIFIADCIEYSHLQSGQRLEAVAFATQTFANKASTALGGAMAMGYLAMVGFVQSTAGVVVKQPPEVTQGMWDVLNLGNAIGAAIGLVIFLLGYKLTDQILLNMKENALPQDNTSTHLGLAAK